MKGFILNKLLNQNIDSTNAATQKKSIKDFTLLILGFEKRLNDRAKFYGKGLKSEMIEQGRVKRKCQLLQGRGRKEKIFQIRDLISENQGFLKAVDYEYVNQATNIMVCF